jgi:hypothetical protein
MALSSEPSPAPVCAAGSGARAAMAERRAALAHALNESDGGGGPSRAGGDAPRVPRAVTSAAAADSRATPARVSAADGGAALAAVAERRAQLARSLLAASGGGVGGGESRGGVGGRIEYPRESAEALRERRVAMASILAGEGGWK